ncbi:MAG: hypothetical protein HC799_16180 [Limnothrix sp. RL_2_0]|nr:hypothetical protein [Limnothrix sp. RL_2_0]
MGAADILLGELPSQIKRVELGNEGKRVIQQGEQNNGFLGINLDIPFVDEAWNAVSGFLLKAIAPALSFTASSIWSYIVQTTQFIWNFDFNATDQQLDQQLNNMKLIIAGQTGGTLGNLVGYLTCGVAPGAAIFVFNEQLGAVLLKEVSEEAFDEFMGNLFLLSRSVFYLGTQWALTTAFKSGRRAIKNFFADEGSPQSQLASRLFGNKFNDLVDAWGDGKGVWSLANGFNSVIDSIPIDWLQEFTEEFFEEAFDACVEAGYVLANGIDAWAAQRRLESKDQFGEERGVEITPDREAPSERVVMVAPERLLKPAMTQYMTQYQMVENRDLGQFVGEPVRDYVKATPAKLSVKLVWSRFDSPPVFRGGEVYKPPTLEIKNFDRLRLDFAQIRLLMGGANGRYWGRFWASASLLDGWGNIVARPKLFAGSESEAENMLIGLLALSDHEIGTLSTGEERRIGRKAPGRALAKETQLVYPAYMTILNAEKVLSEEEGQDQVSGTYRRREQRLPLWTETKPPEWEEVINELLTNPGVSPTAS